MHKVVFVVSHYIWAIMFLFSCWGISHCIYKPILNQSQKIGGLEHALGVALGLGIFICIFQLLAILGYLKFTWIVILFSSGILFGLTNFTPNVFRRLIYLTNYYKSLAQNEKLLLIIIFIVALPTLFKPLRPPGGWDALMYHLPHAKQWAITGSLSVNHWLRYPWFPFNVELLYSASMLVIDDVMPQMLNAISGWLVAFMLYNVARRYFNFWIAGIAVIIWLVLTRSVFGQADIDMALTLFLFAACITFYFWLKNQESLIWLLISSFFIGLSVGSKYQALMFLPLFFVVLIYFEHNWRKLSLVLICFLIPCIYWYARNAILTGDPFNPIGGKLFGFTEWDAGDFEYQFADLERVKAWPHWILWSAPFGLLCKEFRDLLFKQAIAIFCVYGFLIWLIVSHYPRYLLPVVPLLAILAALGWYWLLKKTFNLNNIGSWIKRSKKLKYFGLIVLILVISADGLIRASTAWRKIASNSLEREEMLLKKSSAHAVVFYMNKNFTGKTYQFGLENMQYYLQNETWGDHFGPGRYRNFAKLNSEELYHKFNQSGFRNLLINTYYWPDIDVQPKFDCYFTLAYESNPVKLYLINKEPKC